MVRKTRKTKRTTKRTKKVKKTKRKNYPFWVVDGSVGLLALAIYNLLLYLLSIIGIRGPVFTMQQTMGYFGLNTFLDLGFTTAQMFLGVVIVLAVSFVLGIGIGNIVRRRRKEI